jgi:hypothetical protein
MGGSSQLPQGKATPTTELLLSYSKQELLYLASQDITQIFHAVALHNLHFCVNPASVECCSQCTSSTIPPFSCRVNAPLIKLVGHCHSDVLFYQLYLQSCPIISRLSKLMLAGGDPQLLVETTTMPLPKPSLIVGSWGTRTTIIVLDWPSKAKIAPTRKEILHYNKSCLVLDMFPKKKYLHHKSYKKHKNNYTLHTQNFTHYSKEQFHNIVKKFFTGMKDYLPTKKRILKPRNHHPICLT